MKKLKTASNNSLCELSCLMGRINNLIQKDFIHVDEFISKSLLKELSKFDNSIEKEFNRREM